MAWIECHSELEQHPKFIKFRLVMGLRTDEAVGLLIRFWWRVLDTSPSGEVSHMNDAEIVREMFYLTKNRAKSLMFSLIDSGFVDKRADGRLYVHDWLDYAGTYLRGSKFRRNPSKYDEIAKQYPATVTRQVDDKEKTDGGQAGDCQGKRVDTYLPTNLPTNLPTDLPPGGGVWDSFLDIQTTAKPLLAQITRQLWATEKFRRGDLTYPLVHGLAEDVGFEIFAACASKIVEVARHDEEKKIRAARRWLATIRDNILRKKNAPGVAENLDQRVLQIQARKKWAADLPKTE